MEQNDEELVDRMMRREQEGFSLLFQRHRAMVYNHLEGIVRDPATADDLTQEVFLRLWHKATQWKREGALSSWLLRIGTNLALNHLRSVRRRREQPIHPPSETSDTGAAQVDIPALIDSCALPADEEAARSQYRRMLLKVVDQLPDEKQIVVRMIYDAHMETRQVAAELGIPEGTVKSRLFHARQQIARSWKELGIDWEDFQ